MDPCGAFDSQRNVKPWPTHAVENVRELRPVKTDKSRGFKVIKLAAVDPLPQPFPSVLHGRNVGNMPLCVKR